MLCMSETGYRIAASLKMRPKQAAAETCYLIYLLCQNTVEYNLSQIMLGDSDSGSSTLELNCFFKVTFNKVNIIQMWAIRFI